MGDKKYCICCGEEVPYYIVERDQKREYACSYCGFTLEVLKLWEEREEGVGAKAKEEIEEKIEKKAEAERAEVKAVEKQGVKKRIDEEIKEQVEVKEEKQDSRIEADIKEEKVEQEIKKEKGVPKKSEIFQDSSEVKDDRIEDKRDKKIELRIEEKVETKDIIETDKPTRKIENEGPPKNLPQGGSNKEVIDTAFKKEAIKIKVEEKQSGTPTNAIIAEDSEFLRTLLKEIILRKSLSDNVIAVTNGLELVAEYTRLMSEGASINFAIVDINMPEMDGLTAVRTIRALEDKNGIERVPVVFFSAVKATEDLRKQMSILEPANYINKGVSPSPQILAERVEVLLHFLTYRYARYAKKEGRTKVSRS